MSLSPLIFPAIETLVEGEYVLARDQNDPEAPLALCRILKVYRRIAYHLQFVSLRDAEGREQTLQTTNEHPFFAVDSGEWIKAECLVAGQRVVSPSNVLSEVTENVREERPDGVMVYNLKVEGAQTYFVRAEGSDAEPVWVHNADYSLEANRLGYKRASSNLVDAAFDYRLNDTSLTGGRNLTVVKLIGEDVLRVFKNIPRNELGEGVHSEEVAKIELSGDGYTAQDIEAFYTERSPCPQYCQKTLSDWLLPESKVFWSFKYNTPEVYVANYINDAVASIRNSR